MQEKSEHINEIYSSLSEKEKSLYATLEDTLVDYGGGEIDFKIAMLEIMNAIIKNR
jgi:hypothetical protein